MAIALTIASQHFDGLSGERARRYVLQLLGAAGSNWETSYFRKFVKVRSNTSREGEEF
jgi:hypothetical protein